MFIDEFRNIERLISEKKSEDAKKNLFNILSLEPLNSRANELLAYIIANEGELNKAHELLLIANLDIHSSSESNYYLGVSFLRKGQYINAIKFIETSISKSGEFYEGLVQIAIAFGYLSNYLKAEEALLKAIRINPHKCDVAFINLGKLKHKQKSYDSALDYYNKALKLVPESEDALFNKAVVYVDLEDYNSALDIFLIILKKNGDHEKTIINIAVLFNKLGKYIKSIEYSKRILNKNKNELALLNFADSYCGLKKYKEAINIYSSINDKSTNYFIALNGKGVALNGLCKYEEAIYCYDKVIIEDESKADALSNKAHTLNEIYKYEDALKCINQAIDIDNSKRNYHLIKAYILFNLRKFELAWSEYEWRNKINDPSNSYILKFNKLPKWDGVDYSKKIVIWGEQGLGDQILFSSALNELNEFKVLPTVLINKKMLSVYRKSFTKYNFLDMNSDLEIFEYEYQISIIDLQKYYRKSLENFKNIKVPYLYNKNEYKKIKIENSENKIICGLSWMSFGDEIGNEKSIPLENFEFILNSKKIKFIDIQYYPKNKREIILKEHKKLEKIKNINLYENFDILVEIVDQCDIIVTCSNTTAHVAGALGKNAFLLTPKYKGRHWYWQKDINDISLFYPTVVILEQEFPQNWKHPIAKLEKLLENL
jgi:tetratricopeptide (TPR) repeat protein